MDQDHLESGSLRIHAVTYDWIFVGGGLANGLAAYRLAMTKPDLSILVLEKGERLGGDHTWSFHARDVDEKALKWLEPFFVGRWPSHEVRFPLRERTLHSGYFSIRSEKFHEVVSEKLSGRVRYRQTVRRVEPDGVMLEDGTWLTARAVIDGRGFVSGDHTGQVGYQNFVGQDVKLKAPHGLRGPILMDAVCEQRGGFRFFYVLPWSEDRLLIEDTRYSNSPHLDREEARAEITRYARLRGWEIEQVEREEQGSLPIPFSHVDPKPEEARGPVCLGVRAGLFHPTTGYSLPDAVRVADLIARWGHVSSTRLAVHIARYGRRIARGRWFYRYLNRMLFFGGPERERYKILQRFYGLPEDLVQRFYAATLTLADGMRLLAGRPPIPVVRALRLLFAAKGGSYAH